MVGVAVKVTLVPAQIVVALALMLTLAGRFGFTVMVMLFDVAGEPVKHGVALEVIITRTTSLLERVLLVNVALFAPTTLLPFTRHW